jgi:hypothetical protein
MRLTPTWSAMVCSDTRPTVTLSLRPCTRLRVPGRAPYRSWWRYDVGQVAQSARDRPTRARGHWNAIDVRPDGAAG